MHSLNFIKTFLFFIFYAFLIINSVCAEDNSRWLKINKEGMVAFKERDFIKAEILYLQAIEEAKKSGAELFGSETLINDIIAGKINFDKLMCQHLQNSDIFFVLNGDKKLIGSAIPNIRPSPTAISEYPEKSK